MRPHFTIRGMRFFSDLGWAIMSLIGVGGGAAGAGISTSATSMTVELAVGCWPLAVADNCEVGGSGAVDVGSSAVTEDAGISTSATSMTVGLAVGRWPLAEAESVSPRSTDNCELPTADIGVAGSGAEAGGSSAVIAGAGISTSATSMTVELAVGCWPLAEAESVSPRSTDNCELPTAAIGVAASGAEGADISTAARSPLPAAEVLGEPSTANGQRPTANIGGAGGAGAA